MKILKLIGALILSLALFIDVGPVAVHAQENELVSEDDAYDSTFSGPLIYCRRADTAVALSDDGETMPILCDNAGKLHVTGGGGGEVTNAGTFAVQEDGAALTALQAIQAAIEATLTVTATNLDVQSGGADLVTAAQMTTLDTVLDAIKIDTEAIETAVELTTQLANSPVTEVAILTIIDGSGDADVLTTNLGKSSAITITGSGRITKICLVVEGTAPFSEDGTIYFFDADPAINSNTTDMTVAEAITVVSMISLKGADYNDNFATIKINCQAADEAFHAITHVAYEQEGSTTIANQDFRLHVWYERRS